jgi:transposase-like protein
MAETGRKFDQDFKEGAVRLVRETGKPIAQVAKDLRINEGTLGNWVNADRRRRGEGTELGEDERADWPDGGQHDDAQTGHPGARRRVVRQRAVPQGALRAAGRGLGFPGHDVAPIWAIAAAGAVAGVWGLISGAAWSRRGRIAPGVRW